MRDVFHETCSLRHVLILSDKINFCRGLIAAAFRAASLGAARSGRAERGPSNESERVLILKETQKRPPKVISCHRAAATRGGVVTLDRGRQRQRTLAQGVFKETTEQRERPEELGGFLILIKT